MKFIRNIFTIFASAAIMSSCNFLDVSESDYYELDEIQESFNQVKGHCTNIYGYLRHGFCNIDGAMHDAASDDALHVYESSNIQRFVNGTWAPNNTIDDEYEHYYKGIRDANFYFENFIGLDFKSWETNPDYKHWYKEYLNYEHEIRVLRAYFYFELVKRYQNIPLVTKVLNQSEANAQVPAKASDIFDFIISECTAAAEVLPVNYKEYRSEEFGRVTKGTALALKSRAALYAASPLFNPGGDKDKWAAAASAAYEIIGQADVLGYELSDDFNKLFGNTNRLNKEVIFYRHYQKGNEFEKKNYPWGVHGGQTSTCPSENLASAFEMKDGSKLDWNKVIEEGLDPYENRDPRFYMTIVHNGMKWPQDEPVEIFEGGANAQPLPNATKTGYYLRKYLNNTVNFAPGESTTKPEHNWVMFRYAEILLNYAEAMTHAYGVDDKGSFGLSAREAVNMVRARKGVEMPAIPSMNAEDFLVRVKNERRVELAFEGHRFWDIRRWKELESNSALKCVTIIPFGNEYIYKLSEIERPMEDKMYFYPINNKEMFKNDNLVQNPGW